MVLRLIEVTDYEHDHDYDRICFYPFGIVVDDLIPPKYLDWCSEFLGRYNQEWSLGWRGHRQILIFKTEAHRNWFILRWL